MNELMKQGPQAVEVSTGFQSETADGFFGMLRLIGLSLLAVVGLGLGAAVGLLIAIEMGWLSMC